MMHPVVSIGSHVRTNHTETWVCEQCGLKRPLRYRQANGTARKRQSRTCSQACHAMLVKGENNPAYIDGRRLSKGGKPRPKMEEWQTYMIRKWNDGGCTMSGQRLADTIGIARGTIYRYLKRLQK